MLEFKNTTVSLQNGGMSTPFSLVVEGGDVVAVCGAHGTGKSTVLRAILGLEPISEGFITIDGELVTPGSSAYFRQMIAYIPQLLPHNDITVREFAMRLFGLRTNAATKFDFNKLLADWQSWGIEESLANRNMKDISDADLQPVLLSFLPLLKKKIILIDNLAPSEVARSVISRLVASADAEVVYSCVENKIGCNKTINL